MSIRNDVYVKLLSYCDLSSMHKANLLKRGFSEDAILRNVYKTIPSKEKMEEITKLLWGEFHEKLTDVPGFFYKKINGQIVGVESIHYDGIFFPCRNENGEINSLYMRKDQTDGDNKYVHFSAGQAQEVPLNFVPHSPLIRFHSKDIFLTEGVPKGDVASEHLKVDFLCLNGVGMWRNYLPAIEKRSFERLCVANDSDLEKNPTVARATASLVRALFKKTENVSVVIWDQKYKGIDDALVGGQELIYLSPEESKQYLESVFHRLGLGIIDWDGDDADDLTEDQDQWGEIIPLPEERFDLPEVQGDMVPEAIREWAFDLRDRMQAPIEYICVVLISFYSSILGRKVGIRPKAKDTWLVIGNLWALIIGPPSSMKSPIFQAIKRILDAINLELFETYKSEAIDWKALELSIQSRIKACQDDIKSKHKKNPFHPEIPNIQQRMRDLQEQLELSKPQKKQVIINDSTIEKVQEDLAANPNGLAVCRDEMSGLFHSLEKTGRENDRSFLLESFNGNGSYRVSRIQRGDFIIPANCLTLIGGIQPQPLWRYFFDASQSGSLDDGMIQRFLLMVYPNQSASYDYIDREPNYQAEEKVAALFNECFKLDIPRLEGDEVPFVHFEEEAQEIFKYWLIGLERKLRSGGYPDAHLESHFGKYKKLVPALSLIFHTIDNIDSVENILGNIKVKHIEMAIAWAEVLEKHALKVYEGGFTASLMLAKEVYRKITDYEIHQGMSIREIYRKGWKGLDTKKDVLLALEILEEHSIARLKTIQHEKGAPSHVIEINPMAIPLKRKATDRNDKKHSGSSVSNFGGIQ